MPGSVALAVNAIASGAADYVLVHRALHNPAGRYHGNPMQRAAGPVQWTAPQGYFGPLAMIALPYNEYLQRYDAARESMAGVLVEARKNGARIPWSYWHERPLTAEEYLDAPMIADPICRYDCDIPVDGVAAFVLTSADRAKDLPHRPVYVSGYASGHPTVPRVMSHWPLDDIMNTGRETARRLWEHAGVGPTDVDLPQVYDGFSPFVYFWLEALGYCPEGQAHEFVQDGGIDSDAPGGLPVLSGGGALGQRPAARHPADARVLPPAVRARRRAPARACDRRPRVPCVAALRRRRRVQRRAVLMPTLIRPATPASSHRARGAVPRGCRLGPFYDK